MKPLRFISIFIATLAFMFVQAMPAQVEKAAGTATKPAKTAGKAVKDTAQQAGEKTGKVARSATEQTGEKTGKAARSATEPATTPETRVNKGRTTTEGSANRAATVSESEIAAAKAQGKVWVNTQSGVYHKSGQWYGATKQGKFMSEDEAIKAGYRASKGKQQ